MCAHTHRGTERERDPYTVCSDFSELFLNQRALLIFLFSLVLQCCSVYHIIEDIITLSSHVQAASPTARYGMAGKRRCSPYSTWQAAGAEGGCIEGTHMAGHTSLSNTVEMNSDEASKGQVCKFLAISQYIDRISTYPWYEY